MMQKSTPQPDFDRRLIGTWQSDRRKTFEHWKPGKKATPASTRKFQALFGKLQVRYTKKYLYERFTENTLVQGLKSTGKFRRFAQYEIVAKDESSTVIRVIPLKEDTFTLFGDKLIQIRYDGPDGYFISLFPGLSEYFRRIQPYPES